MVSLYFPGEKVTSQSLLNWGLLPTGLGPEDTAQGSSQSLLNWGLLPTGLGPEDTAQGSSQSLLNWGLLPTPPLCRGGFRRQGRNPFLTEVFFLRERVDFLRPLESQSLLNWGLLPTNSENHTWSMKKSRNPFLTEVFFLPRSCSGQTQTRAHVAIPS